MRKCRSCSALIKKPFAHKPNGSEIDLEIFICENCSLIQGFCDEKKYSLKNDNFKNPELILSEISCDSKYSNIRVGKQQMADKFFQLVKKDLLPIDFSKINSVIDVRSARGSFILNAHKLFNSAKLFFALEQDHYLYGNIDNYKNKNITILDNSIYNFKTKEKFDFVYSCHTMEHYKNPNHYLSSIKSLLSNNGYFFLDVPNTLDFIFTPSLDDFFYDKHLIYFEPETLKEILEKNGFSIIWLRNSGNGCIECLSQINHSQSLLNQRQDSNQSRKITYKNLLNYSLSINKLRKKLPNASRALTNWLVNYKSTFAIGSGRILDAFIKYGSLDKKLFNIYVDNFLFDATKEVNNLKISKLKSVKQIPDAAVMFTRNFNESIEKKLKELNPECKIKHWKEFF